MAAYAPGRITRAQRAELLHGIYVIVNDGPRALDLARGALAAGVRIVQYRAKNGITPNRVRTLRALTRDHDALLVMNDDWQAAIDYDCDGVHLGPDDAGFDRVAPVRSALEERLIGLSCGTLDEVRSANDGDADYIGAGSVYATPSKSDAGTPIGTTGLRALCAVSRLPVAAIGGITAERLRDVRDTGVAMAAVISAVAGAGDARASAEALVDAWDRSEAP